MPYLSNEITTTLITPTTLTSQPNSQTTISLAQQILGVDFGENPTRTTAIPLRELPLKPVKSPQRLAPNVKHFIVVSNASGLPPHRVVEAVRETFDLIISRSQVERYDPTKANGQTLRAEYQQLYQQVKREREAALLKIGIANQGFRLALLHDMCAQAMEVGNLKLAANLLAQAAKEVGGYYTKSTKLPADLETIRQALAQLLDCHPDDLPTFPIQASQNHQNLR